MFLIQVTRHWLFEALSWASKTQCRVRQSRHEKPLLTRRAPPPQSSHLALIDALMMAYTVEMISIEKVVASVKRFSTFSASKELPFDLEDAMLFWINKV